MEDKQFDNLFRFLVNFAGYTPDAAQDAIAENPNDTLAFAQQVAKTILEDKTITQETKDKIKALNF